MNKFVIAVGVLSASLTAGILARTAPDRGAGSFDKPVVEVVVPEGAAERLAVSLSIPTISHEDPDALDADAFRRLHDYLEKSFPRTHSQLRRETVVHSLLYTWPGSNASLKPILLMAHFDVVPVEPGTEKKWQADPFSGRIADGFVWGRGAIDNKSAVVGILEAIEMLLAEGFRPARTIYLVYGHDEEVGGTRGARAIAELLKGRGVELEMVLDEGGIISDGLLPGVTAPVALVGVAEKGFASIELGVRVPGGHSSMPPRQGAVGILGAAIARLEQNPMPARLDGPTLELFERLAPEFPVLQRAVFSNLWLTKPLVTRKLEASPTTNAMVRTTAASTMFRAGTKDNVLPSQARAVVNFRIAPGDSVAAVMEHIQRVVNDKRVSVRIGGAFQAEPSAVSSTNSESFRKLERSIKAITPDTLVVPYLVVVATDSRHFAGMTENVLRLLPLRLAPADLGRIHGSDERISVRDYENAIRIYRQLLATSGS